MQTLTLALDALVPEPTGEAKAALAAADIVIGIDPSSSREFTVFGTPALESTTSLKKLSAMRVVRVTLPNGPVDLERLTVLVRRIKGLDAPPGADAPAHRW